MVVQTQEQLAKLLEELTDNSEPASSECLSTLLQVMKRFIAEGRIQELEQYLSNIRDDSILRFRVLESSAKLYTDEDVEQDATLRRTLEDSTLITTILDECIDAGKNNDVLAQANAFELVTMWLSKPYAVDMLIRKDFFNQIEKMTTVIADAHLKQDDLFSLQISILLPLILKFFSAFARHNPQRFLSIFHALLRDHLSPFIDFEQNRDEVLLCSAIELFASLLLQKLPPEMRAVERVPHLPLFLRNVWRLALTHGNENVRLKALDAVKCVVFVTDEKSRKAATTGDLDSYLGEAEEIAFVLFALLDRESSASTRTSREADADVEQLFKPLSDETVQRLQYNACTALAKVISVAKQPITLLKEASLDILVDIAAQRWGAVCVRDTPGCVEYLLNRKTEFTKHGLELKFDIIRGLVSRPSNLSVFDNQTQLHLRQYERDGVFFAPVQAEVATEGAE